VWETVIISLVTVRMKTAEKQCLMRFVLTREEQIQSQWVPQALGYGQRAEWGQGLSTVSAGQVWIWHKPQNKGERTEGSHMSCLPTSSENSVSGHPISLPFLWLPYSWYSDILRIFSQCWGSNAGSLHTGRTVLPMNYILSPSDVTKGNSPS
jgi:hypothetical protein